MVDTGVVENQHRGPGTGGRPGIERLDDKDRVHGCLAGGGVQLVRGRVVEAQHVESLAVTRPGGHLLARQLPTIGDGRGQAKPGFVAVKHVHMPGLFQFLHPGQAFGFVGVVLRVLGFFQRMPKAPPLPATLFKKRRKVLGEKSLANCSRSVTVTSLSC